MKTNILIIAAAMCLALVSCNANKCKSCDTTTEETAIQESPKYAEGELLIGITAADYQSVIDDICKDEKVSLKKVLMKGETTIALISVPAGKEKEYILVFTSNDHIAYAETNGEMSIQ